MGKKEKVSNLLCLSNEWGDSINEDPPTLTHVERLFAQLFTLFEGHLLDFELHPTLIFFLNLTRQIPNCLS